VAEAFSVCLGLDPSCIQVSGHNLTDFVMSIMDRDIFDEVTGMTTSLMVVISSNYAGGHLGTKLLCCHEVLH
jgi:hypothetical protein